VSPADVRTVASSAWRRTDAAADVGAAAEDMSVASWRVDDTDVVRVSGVLDFAAAVRLRLTLYGRLDGGAHRVVVDLTGLRLMDASAVNVLLKVRQRLGERGGSLTAPGANGLVLEVLEIAGVAKQLGAYDPLDPRLADHTVDTGDRIDTDSGGPAVKGIDSRADPAYCGREADRAHVPGDVVRVARENPLLAEVRRLPPRSPSSTDWVTAACLAATPTTGPATASPRGIRSPQSARLPWASRSCRSATTCGSPTGSVARCTSTTR
jgi:anti-anti-sigma factor